MQQNGIVSNTEEIKYDHRTAIYQNYDPKMHQLLIPHLVMPVLNYSMERSQIGTMENVDLLDTILMYKLIYIL